MIKKPHIYTNEWKLRLAIPPFLYTQTLVHGSNTSPGSRSAA
jgi:hypothetical protein